MKTQINDQILYFERLKRAQDAILNAKRLDGAKGGRTIAQIWGDMRNRKYKYYLRKSYIISESEKLNSKPTGLPNVFFSVTQMLEDFGVIESEEGTEFYDRNRFLTVDLLHKVTRRWLELHNRKVESDANYYYNEAFRGCIYTNLVTRGTDDIENIDFFLSALDKPLIYTYYPSRPTTNSDDVERSIATWPSYEAVYQNRMEELGDEEHDASRGEFIVANEGTLYEENGQRVFEIASIKFWAYVDLLYRLSSEHPEYFQQGASTVLDQLYVYYKDAILPTWAQTREEFELKAKRQFLYISSDDKQLRIDLFRHIDPKREQTDEVFTGGLYHVFDHFKGLRVSSKSKGDYTLHEDKLFEIIRDLFFDHTSFKTRRINERGDHWGDKYIAQHVYETPVAFVDGLWKYSPRTWKGVFVLDLAKNLFYLDTLYISKSSR